MFLSFPHNYKGFPKVILSSVERNVDEIFGKKSLDHKIPWLRNPGILSPGKSRNRKSQDFSSMIFSLFLLNLQGDVNKSMFLTLISNLYQLHFIRFLIKKERKKVHLYNV